MYQQFLLHQKRKPELSSFTSEHDNFPFQIVKCVSIPEIGRPHLPKTKIGVQKRQLFVVFVPFVVISRA